MHHSQGNSSKDRQRILQGIELAVGGALILNAVGTVWHTHIRIGGGPEYRKRTQTGVPIGSRRGLEHPVHLGQVHK